jgi:ABC-2 type transport system ATP-binding protein
VVAVAAFDAVVKDYPAGGRGTLRALDGVSLRVEQGEVFGLLGPNRAGKTTLVKLLLSLCRPTAGRVERLGAPASDRQTLARVGYLHENQAFPRYLTATGLLHFYGTLTRLPEATVRRRTPELLEWVGLADRAAEPIARFSKGMVQRLALAQALLNDPDLLVLDEPMEGLDLLGRQLVRDAVTGQRRRGRTALLISHVAAEAEQLCDRAAVVVGGRLAFLGPVAGLTRPDAGRPRTLEAALRELYTTPNRAPDV